jgi:hypothetical protein
MGPHVSRGAGRLSERHPQDPVIVVYSLAHAVAALTAAAEAGRRVAIVSAPDAGIHAGPGWFKALVDAARAAVPAARFSAVLDCGDDAGAAQGAIRAGIETVIFIGRADVAERLAAIAERQGARLLTERPAAAVDLLAHFFADEDTLRRYCTSVMEAGLRESED